MIISELDDKSAALMDGADFVVAYWQLETSFPDSPL